MPRNHGQGLRDSAAPSVAGLSPLRSGEGDSAAGGEPRVAAPLRCMASRSVKSGDGGICRCPHSSRGARSLKRSGRCRRAPLTSSEPWAGCFDRQASLGVWRPLGTCAGEVLTFDSDAGRRRGYGRDSISVATASVSRLDWRRRAGPRALVLVAVGVAGIVATALTAWAVANSPILVHAKSVWIWRALIVAAYVAVGLYRWWRRPDSRFGPLVVGNGFLYAATSFNASGASPAYTLGMVFWAVYVVYTALSVAVLSGGSSPSRGWSARSSVPMR